MERQESQAILLLILVMCILFGAHVLLTMLGNEPFAAPYTPDTPEGRFVQLEGEVEKVTITQEGGHMILRVQGVQIFVPASVAAQREILIGKQIQVFGTIQIYRGQREVLVSRAPDIIVLP